MPAVAADWQDSFSWDGVGRMPVLEELRLRSLVAEAHARGRTLRFWGTPDDPGDARDAVWTMLLDAGVDQVGTDDLAGLATFLARDVDAPPSTPECSLRPEWTPWSSGEIRQRRRRRTRTS